MAQLTEYTEIREKRQFFAQGGDRYDSLKEVIAKIEMFSKRVDFIYRGCSGAKYKLFNSAQRYYITNDFFENLPADAIEDHYTQFISNIIDGCKKWNQETAKKILEKTKIDENNSLAYLSLMQHYGVPSPLLDFTQDPYIALYFAIENLDYVHSDIEIENYFSLYTTYQNATAFELWKSVFGSHYKGLEGKMPYSEVDKNSLTILLPDIESYQLLNNTNIINQKGLFFYNNHPFEPIEERYLEIAGEMKAHLGAEKFQEYKIHEEFANCMNIHKSLAVPLKAILVEKGITKDYIYPDMYQMKKSVMESDLIKSMKGKI